MSAEYADNFTPREDFDREKEKSGRVVKIEARRAKDIIDELYYGEIDADYDDDDYYETPDLEPFEAEEENAQEPLSYIPFDPTEELGKLKLLSTEGRDLSPAQRREILKERLAQIKESLREQNIGIAAIIRNLREIAEANPDAGERDLFDSVMRLAPQYKVSQEQLDRFKRGIERYREKHQAVEKYRKLYPDDKDLFQACFDKKPTGDIRVIKRPMTLHFQCFNLNDYAMAYNSYKRENDASELSEVDKTRVELSGGAALLSVKLEELNGAVTIENMRNNLKYEVVRENKTAEFHNAELELSLDAQRSDVDIFVKGQGQWRIKIVERDNFQFPARIQFFDLNDGDNPVMMFDMVRVPPEVGTFVYSLKEANNPNSRLYGNQIADLKVKKGERFSYFGYININYFDVKIVDKSPEGSVVTYQEDEALPLIFDEELSRRWQRHEEQHQFNKLFIPREASRPYYKVFLEVALNAQSQEEARNRVTHDIAKIKRREFLFDRRARDEVIAFLRDGRKPDEIYKILTENPLYDYFEQSKEAIGKLPQEIKEEIEQEMSEVIYQREPDQEGYSDYIVDAAPLTIEESLVEKHINAVFKDEYKRDLKHWLEAITTLERKGYNQEEIVSIIAQEPARNWNALARRLNPKERETV